jgi:hypothetical protein
MATINYKGFRNNHVTLDLGPSEQEPSTPFSMQDGWCVDEKHFFIVFVFDC